MSLRNLDTSLLDMKSKLKVVCWNILAPELLMYFWRSSYGLEAPRGKQYYDNINLMRINNMIKWLSEYDADIICLQEVTDSKYSYLNGLSIQEYIANQMQYTIVSQSFKASPFKFGYPPNEQFLSLNADSGVATLIKSNSIAKLTRHIAVAEDFGDSNIFKTGVGSPFTLDEFMMNNKTFFIANIHVRMDYPHILRPINESYDRIISKIGEEGMQNAFIMGDFNADNIISARELFSSYFYLYMFNKKGYDMNYDHIFIGKNFAGHPMTMEYDNRIPLLEMNVNKPTSDSKIWKNANVQYTRSDLNNKLVNNMIVTTDHHPIIFAIDFSLKENPAINLGGSFRKF